MSDRTAWIASDEEQVQKLAEEAIAGETGCKVRSFPLKSLLSGDLPRESAGWVLVDLKRPESWRHLPTISKRLSRVSCHDAAKVAMIDRGYPLDCAIEADRIFDGAWCWDSELPSIRRLFDESRTNSKRKSVLYSSGSRQLQAGDKKYVTYTPELFPVFEKIERAAEHDFTVLLVGETGTGKTTFARIVHQLSRRRNERFLTVACGAMPSELMGSELFGHVRGAFTGADRDKGGKFDVAHRGSLLLDEIDVLDIEQQANLLRVIETGEFEPVGSNDTHKTDVRVVAASNQSLEHAIEKQQFRADLFFRLNEVKFEIPPLRERVCDIVPLAVDFISDCCRDKGLNVQQVDPAYFELLKHYNWPGNIRELRNEVRHSALFCCDSVLRPSLLSPDVQSRAEVKRAESYQEMEDFGLSNEVARTEQEAIEEMLEIHGFNRAATARALGISRVTLYNKIRKYQIETKGKSN